MVFGTDAGVMPHGSAGGQFRCMVEYGMTPMEAIQAATRNAAQALGPGDATSARSRSAATATSSRSTATRSPTSAQLEDVDVVIKGGEVVKRGLMPPLDGAQCAADFHAAVNMSADELEAWLGHRRAAVSASRRTAANRSATPPAGGSSPFSAPSGAD